MTKRQVKSKKHVLSKAEGAKGKTKAAAKPGKRGPSNRKTKRKRPRLPISAVRVKSLAYEHGALAAADGHCKLARPLADIIEKHPKLDVAWNRGQFLRNLEAEAASSPSLSRTAGHLGFTGQQLRALLDGDCEADDLWRQGRMALEIRQNERVFERADEGKDWAVRLVEEFLKSADDGGFPAAGRDTKRMMQKEIAELFAVTCVTVREWTDKHRCPRNGDGSYNLAEVIGWHIEFVKRKTPAGRILPADKLRDLKAEEKRLDIEHRRGNLLDRDEVAAGLLARWQAILGACRYKGRELAALVHGQTAENIESICERFFEDLQRQWLDVPSDFLRLPEAAEVKFGELLESLKAEGKEKGKSMPRAKSRGEK